MDIFFRPPSASWEPVALPDVPGAAVWAWFRPPAAPCGIIFQIPRESHAAFPEAFTLRRLLSALGIDCRLMRMCLTCAGHFDGMQGMNPLLDRPLCPPPPGLDPTIAVHLAPPMTFARAGSVMTSHVAMPAAGAFAPPAGMARGEEAVYHAIEADWHAIQILESKNLTLRKQLNSQITRLMTFNRDLSPEERNASDMTDHRDWQDARRWIRDGASILSRVVRAHDVGTTSAAGNRNRFDDIIDIYVTPRRPHPNLAEVRRQFDVHRKTVQLLNTEMQAAAHGPAREGEMKAQTVLLRIRAKVQAARGRR